MANWEDIAIAVGATDYPEKIQTLTDRAEASRTEIENARDGESTLLAKNQAQDSRMTTIESTASTLATNVANASAITDGAVGEVKLDVNNAPTDTYVLAWNNAAGKMEWQDVSGVVGADTYQVKYDAGDAAGYLDAKVAQIPITSLDPGTSTTGQFMMNIGGNIVGITVDLELEEAISAISAYNFYDGGI